MTPELLAAAIAKLEGQLAEFQAYRLQHRVQLTPDQVQQLAAAYAALDEWKTQLASAGNGHPLHSAIPPAPYVSATQNTQQTVLPANGAFASAAMPPPFVPPIGSPPFVQQPVVPVSPAAAQPPRQLRPSDFPTAPNGHRPVDAERDSGAFNETIHALTTPEAVRNGSFEQARQFLHAAIRQGGQILPQHAFTGQGLMPLSPQAALPPAQAHPLMQPRRRVPHPQLDGDTQSAAERAAASRAAQQQQGPGGFHQPHGHQMTGPPSGALLAQLARRGRKGF